MSCKDGPRASSPPSWPSATSATARTGESRYVVEPNIKDGKGGLRDLHTLYWLAKYLYGQGDGASDGREAAIFTAAEELPTFRRCEDFLWAVRCHLHFLTGRAEERLTFDVQPRLAERLGYNDRARPDAVERFMKHYFLVAKDVGDLTRILCSALEMQQLKSIARAVALCSAAELAHAPPDRARRPIFASTTAGSMLPTRTCSSATRSTSSAFSPWPQETGLASASRRHPPAAPIAAPDRRRSAQRPRGQPHVPRTADRRRQSRDDAAAHERSGRARPLHSRVRPHRRA